MSSTPMPTPTMTASPAAPTSRWAVWWRGWLKPARVLVLPGVVPGQGEGNDLPVPAFDAALLAWRDWCRAHAGQRCKLALSSAWTLTGLAPAHTDTSPHTTAAQAIDHMARQWDHYLGVGAVALGRDWVVRTTRVPGGWLVCATPRQLVNDVLAIAQRHQVRVVWMGPWWTRGLQRWVRQARASALQINEPGWCLHAVCSLAPSASTASKPCLTQLWSEPVSANHGPAQNPHADPGTTSVSLGRHGAASAACVWDDAATQDLIDGRPSAWLSHGGAA